MLMQILAASNDVTAQNITAIALPGAGALIGTQGAIAYFNLNQRAKEREVGALEESIKQESDEALAAAESIKRVISDDGDVVALKERISNDEIAVISKEVAEARYDRVASVQRDLALLRADQITLCAS